MLRLLDCDSGLHPTRDGSLDFNGQATDIGLSTGMSPANT
jgi:hypothetical protein